MAACGTCSQNVFPLPPAASLFQIRSGYRAQWNGLRFSVECDAGDWTVRVQDSATMQTLYTARRPQPRAAQLAAAEFALFQVFGGVTQVSPERLVHQLNWQPYW